MQGWQTEFHGSRKGGMIDCLRAKKLTTRFYQIARQNVSHK